MPLHPCIDACRLAEMEEREKRLERTALILADALIWIAGQRTGGMIQRKAVEALSECGMLPPNAVGKRIAEGESGLSAGLGKETTMKMCKKCGQEKPEHLFYKNGNGYLCSPCKDCVNKVKRKPRKRTEAAISAEKRYREKKRILAEIAAMPVRMIDDA